jgi:hypothetical protein
MPKMPPKPHYYEDKSIDELLAEIEEIISSSREMARDLDNDKAPVKNSVAIRKQLAKVTHLVHSLRKEVVLRREQWRKRKAEEGRV